MEFFLSRNSKNVEYRTERIICHSTSDELYLKIGLNPNFCHQIMRMKKLFSRNPDMKQRKHSRIHFENYEESPIHEHDTQIIRIYEEIRRIAKIFTKNYLYFFQFWWSETEGDSSWTWHKYRLTVIYKICDIREICSFYSLMKCCKRSESKTATVNRSSIFPLVLQT